MRRIDHKTIIIIILVLIILAELGLSRFTDREISFFTWLKKGFYNLVTPVIESLSNFFNYVKAYWNGIMNIDDLIEANEQLRKEVSQYRIQLLLNDYYKRENRRLRELLSFKEQAAFESLGAHVIGYNLSNWDNRLLINLGSRDGIEERMPVITYDGALVGRIEYVGATTAQVLLCNDPEFIVGGIVDRPESRAIGLLKGQVNKPEVNLMENISWNTYSEEGDIKVGDLIVTSGLSDSYPRGIPIGEVISVETDNYGLSQKAEIKLFMNRKTIEEVLVITGF